MMSRDELLERLDMDSPEDFGYFEQFAELVECDDEIDFDDFYYAISAAETDTVAEINENYFTELEKGFPDDCDDLLEILQEIWNNLKLLCADIDDPAYRREYADQLFKFHELYTKPDGASVDGRVCSVMEAVAENRAAKIDNVKHSYDFGNSLDYEPDYISMRLGEYTDEYDSDTSMQDD